MNRVTTPEEASLHVGHPEYLQGRADLITDLAQAFTDLAQAYSDLLDRVEALLPRWQERSSRVAPPPDWSPWETRRQDAAVHADDLRAALGRDHEQPTPEPCGRIGHGGHPKGACHP